MLYEFLKENEKQILAMTEMKSVDLAGIRPNSPQLKEGLPIFFKQLMTVLKIEAKSPRVEVGTDKDGMAEAADNNDEEAMAMADGRPDEAEVAKAAGLHGQELLRLGYTLSHVVHAYGSMCQSITELATKKNMLISASEFHDLNRCLDTGIAGAVTEYQAKSNKENKTNEIEQLGFLAHELRNALGTVQLSFQLIKSGTVGLGGSVGQVMERGLSTMANLVSKSLNEVKMHSAPEIQVEALNLLQLVDQILVTVKLEAEAKKQTIEVRIPSDLSIQIDRHLFHSALSNLIQNALKYTHSGGKIQIHANKEGETIVVEVEDECGGLSNVSVDLFKPFEQQNKNRTGLGLGLTIAQKAIALNNGKIEVQNLPGKGCVFRIILSKNNMVLDSHGKTGQMD